MIHVSFLFILFDRFLTPIQAGDIEFNDPDSATPIIYNNGDIAWVLASTALVWLMIPGVGFFYSGLLRRKNALSMIYLSMMTVAVVSFQWFFWGFSLAFSPTGGRYIGNLSTSSPSLYQHTHLTSSHSRVLRSQGCSGPTLHRQLSYPPTRLLHLPTHVRRHHVSLRRLS